MTTRTESGKVRDAKAYEAFVSEIRTFIPSERIYTDELRRLGWGTDAGFYRQIPHVVIRSDGEEELSRLVQACERHDLPFTFRAAGTSLSGQSISDSVLIVAGKHWEKYELGRDAETIKLQPGIVGARVNEILRPYGRVFPPDPASVGSAMVGGIVCNNASGMNCGVHANSDRMMVSARMILTDGTVVDTGDVLASHDVKQLKGVMGDIIAIDMIGGGAHHQRSVRRKGTAVEKLQAVCQLK